MWLNPTVLLVEAQRVLHRGREEGGGGEGGREGRREGGREGGRGEREGREEREGRREGRREGNRRDGSQEKMRNGEENRIDIKKQKVKDDEKIYGVLSLNYRCCMMYSIPVNLVSLAIPGEYSNWREKRKTERKRKRAKDLRTYTHAP